MRGILLIFAISFVTEACFDTECNNILPGIDRLAFGVDIVDLSLQPVDINQRNGFAGALFDFTCYQGCAWYNPTNQVTYSCPDQIASIASLPGDSLKAQTVTYKTVSDVTQKMAAVVGIGYAPGMFSGTGSYQQFNNGITKDFKEITEIVAFVSSSEAAFVPAVSLDVSWHTQLALNQLTRSFQDSPDDYYKFISQFGTHYFAKGKFGGQVRQVFETSRHYYNSHSTRDMQAQAEKSFENMIAVKGGGVDQTSKVDEDFKKSTKSEAYFNGGNLDLLQEGGIKQWQATVHSNPWVFGATLAPIYDLIKNQSQKDSMANAVQAHLDKAFLKELRSKLKHGENEAVKKAEAKVLAQLDRVIPDHGEVEDLVKNVQVVAPPWWKAVQICYKYEWFSRNAWNFLAETPTCAYVGEYTEAYYDNAQGFYSWASFEESLRFKKYMNNRQISWSISIGSPFEEWFKKVQICFRYSATGFDTQCNRGRHLLEICAPVNEYTEYYLDRTNDLPGGCKMSWQLRVPEESPIWLLNTKLCFKWWYHLTRNTGECGAGSNETICATSNHWTDWYLDDTDSRSPFGSGCAMQWMIH